ncbi:tetratricopeptide repeat protein [Massilia atriviolacea]|uniref:Tetratricopeptide repeat protein n=1 Tax=Massilia atriviolacea TaxID=2495579 RepID=A0A430HQX5_9BURK|nr:tetratricopeptide repeat protein [Massilia atriviolacea]RSZ59931.1 tetratricopeptide repeat protein [Massilia atriviolacea]
MNPNITKIASFDGVARLTPEQFRERFPAACVGQRRDPQPRRCAEAVDRGARTVDSDGVRVVLLSGNVAIDSALLDNAADADWTHIAVDGDLHLDGCGADVFYARGIDKVYYVGGDLHVASVDLGAIASNAVAGRIVANSAWLCADDDCAMRTAPELRVHARFLFAWFYSIDDLKIAPATVVFILGSGYYCDKLRLPNPVFQWHEDIHVLAEPFVRIVEGEGSDANGWINEAIDRALGLGRTIFRDGFDIACYPHHRAAQIEAGKDEHRAAYLLHKRSAAVSPGFYEAWLGMGDALFAVGAYRQALAAYKEAGTLFPEDQNVLVNLAYNYGSLSALYLGDHDQAIALASMSIAHNSGAGCEDSDHGYAYRCRAEAYLLSQRPAQALADLERALELDNGDAASHWLLGLFHYQRGDMQQARACHAAASKYEHGFDAYADAGSGTACLYQEPSEVDWA